MLKKDGGFISARALRPVRRNKDRLRERTDAVLIQSKAHVIVPGFGRHRDGHATHNICSKISDTQHFTRLTYNNLPQQQQQQQWWPTPEHQLVFVSLSARPPLTN